MAASLLGNTPLECAQAFWKAHCAYERKGTRRQWEQAVAQLATYEFQIILLGDGFAEPVEDSQDPMGCAGERTFKARVTAQTPTTATVMIATGFPEQLVDTVELLLVLDRGSWRVNDTQASGGARKPREPLQPPAKLLKPVDRARVLYERYLPGAMDFDGYPQQRNGEAMLALSRWLTRSFVMRLLTGPHPGDAAWVDELICFEPLLNSDSALEPPLTLSEKAGVVTVTQPQPDGGTSVPAQLHFVKQDVWRLDKVTCPKGRAVRASGE